MRILLTTAFFLVITGCSSSPSFVGTWHADNLPEEGMPDDDATRSTVVINEDGTFGAAFDNADGDLVIGFNGTWSELESGGIRMVIPNGPEGMATLLDQDTLLATGQGAAVRFQRQK
jgi:hypothetical protein